MLRIHHRKRFRLEIEREDGVFEEGHAKETVDFEWHVLREVVNAEQHVTRNHVFNAQFGSSKHGSLNRSARGNQRQRCLRVSIVKTQVNRCLATDCHDGSAGVQQKTQDSCPTWTRYPCRKYDRAG